MNNRILPKERGLIKGAVRRVFSRSELRKAVLNKAKVTHHDAERPRVKTWYRCQQCKGFFAQHELQVDHHLPIIPVNKSLEDMSWDELVDNIWCDPKNLIVLCKKPCHSNKTKIENAERRKNKKEKKLNE